MSALADLQAKYADINALHNAAAIMEWDQQVLMPHGGAPARAAHVGSLTRMAHEGMTSDAMAAAIAALEGSASSDVESATARVMRRHYDQSTKIPAKLVEEKSRLSSEAHETWVEARKENDFSKFARVLNRMVEICREEADALGYEESPYDALVDQYEEGATAADCKALFDQIQPGLSELVAQIGEKPETDDSILTGEWNDADQKQFTEMLVKAIGFDMERGRQDTAPHPFCTNFSIGDVRLTTRFLKEVDSAIFGSLHEAGHGMYEQGSPMEWDRTPLAGGVSLGVHESQSRLWENIVGRSRAFWTRFYPDFQRQFPTFANVSLDDFHRAVNKVKPSLIRVEADEVTYCLHIIIRFELEKAMIEGDLKTADVPEAWNAKYEQYLGVRPESDANGCLQDVHWSAGLHGYFPTYAIGSVLSFQIWETLKADLGDVDAQMESGDFSKILGWLQEKIYSKGQMLTPKELVRSVTGEDLKPEPFLNGLRAKYGELYSL